MGFSAAEIRAVRLACCIAGFITPLLSTMMNLSLVHIGTEFGVGSHDLAYVNSSFLLASVIFMVPFAKYGDIIGKKKTFIIGLVIIAVGCVLAYFSPSFWFMIGCRALIGVGSAALTTVSISLLADVVPKEIRGSAIGFQTTFVYIGLAVGPAIGGALNDIIGWRALFLLSLPLAIASLIVIMELRQEITPDEGGVLDVKSSLVYSIGIALTMIGAMNMPQYYAIASLVIGLVLMIVFVKMQIGNPHCILEMDLFKSKMFSGSCIAAFLSYASSFSITFFLPLYLQSIGHLTSTQAGLMMMIQPVIQIIGTPIFGRISDIIDNKTLLPTVGMALISVGVLCITFYGMHTSLSFIVMTMIVTGIGCSLFSAPNTSVIMSSVPLRHSGEASAMVSFMRQTGMMVSMGIAMMVITLVMGSADNLRPETYGLFLDVIKISFTICFIMCVIGTILSSFRSSKKAMT